MCDFCEKYANVSGKHGTIRLGQKIICSLPIVKTSRWEQ